MKFGIILPNYGPQSSTSGLRKVTAKAESLGYESVWTTDHVLLPQSDSARFGQLYEAITTLCFLAGQTSSIRLGISSLVLPQRNPIVVAKQIATLDALSKGRAMLCVGAGWSAGEYKNLGSNFEDRGQRMDEAIDLLRALWSSDLGESISFNGENYHFQDAVFSPTPVQAGGPPIWVGGHSKAAIRRAVERGDGWHPSSLSLQAFTALAREYLKIPGSRRATLSARLRLSFDNSDPTAQLIGPPDTIVNTLLGYQRAGLQYAVISLPGETSSEQIEAMGQFSEDVAPPFKAER